METVELPLRDVGETEDSKRQPEDELELEDEQPLTAEIEESPTDVALEQTVSEEQASDPFGDDFDEEEVIVDHYATLRQTPPADIRAVDPEVMNALREPLFDGEDGISETKTMKELAEELRELRGESSSQYHSPPADDNDLIVVVDDDLEAQGSGDGNPQRQEYRQLFSKLRQI